MKTKKIYVLLVFLLAICACNTKSNEPIETPETNAETVILPKYPGDKEALIKDLNALVKYPEEALQENFTGRVYVSFKVNDTGKVMDAKIARGVGPVLDKEALRVVNNLNKTWIPGKKNGEAVSSEVTIYFDFKEDAQIETSLIEPDWKK